MIAENTQQYLFATIAGLVSYLFLIIIAVQVFDTARMTPFVPWGIVAGGIVSLVASGVVMHLAILFEQKIKGVTQLIKFALVGVLNTLVDVGVLNVLFFFIQGTGAVGAILLKGISFTAAVINSYVWNKHWTFGAKNSKNAHALHKEFLVFLTISTLGLLINVTAFAIGQSIFTFLFSTNAPSITATISAATASVISLGWNFFGYKKIVFKT